MSPEFGGNIKSSPNSNSENKSMDGASPSLVNCFESITDPRVDRTKLHKLVDSVVMAICAAVAGCDTFDAI